MYNKSYLKYEKKKKIWRKYFNSSFSINKNDFILSCQPPNLYLIYSLIRLKMDDFFIITLKFPNGIKYSYTAFFNYIFLP